MMKLGLQKAKKFLLCQMTTDKARWRIEEVSGVWRNFV
jgi:hypothetical protein